MPVLTQILSSLDTNSIEFTSFTGSEGISKPYEYTLTIDVLDHSISLANLVGSKVTCKISQGTITQEGLMQEYTGIVSKYRMNTDSQIRIQLMLTIVPKFTLLKHRRDSKVFQDLTVEEVVKEVLTKAGMNSGSDFKMKITGSYNKLPYCIQYNETDFDFVSRLLEQEGLFYFFEHSDENSLMVITDDIGSFATCEGIDTIRFQYGKNVSDISTVWNNPAMCDECYYAAKTEEVVSGKYTTTDYNFEQPLTSLLTNAETGIGVPVAGSDTYEFPGEIYSTSDSSSLTTKRAEELEAETVQLLGKSYVRSLRSGYIYTLTEHDNSSFNDSYVITEMSVHCTYNEYHNEFKSIKSSTKYRSRRTTPKPMIHGYLSGKVVGPAGEEIFTDEYGRIKVQFPWDRLGKNNETSSMFIRVAQMWAGKGYGSMYIPRIGMEVIVAFLDGDPDRPVVIGTLYNADYTIPYAQPNNKETSTILTRSSPKGDAGNELRFVDKKDSEEVYIHAQKDWNNLVENDRTTHIKANDKLNVDETRTVEVIKDNTEHFKANHAVTVDGNYTLDVTGTSENGTPGNFTITVKGDLSIIAENISIEARKAISVKAGEGITVSAKQDIDTSTDAKYKVSSKQDMELNTKTNFTMNATANATLDAKAKMDVKTATLTTEGSAKATHKGGMVEVNGQGMTDVKSSGIVNVQGSIVKIN
ncbi:MAG: type VI secretion system tip protein TssI/VgrG [Candidatus Kapaibacterium sp.]